MQHSDGQQEQHAEYGHGRPHRGIGELFLFPLFVPLVSGIVIFAVILSVSQLLLAVGESTATPIALLLALVALLGCAYLAAAPKVSKQLIYSAIAVPLVLILAAGGLARLYRVNNPEKKHEGGIEASATPPAEVMTDNKFSVTNYTVPANTQVTLDLQNKGQALHNLDILNVKDSVTMQDIKPANFLAGGDDVQLQFTIAQPGTYKFQCDVHPALMIGQVTVVNAPAGGTSAAAGGGLQEVTTDEKFSQTSLTAPAGQPIMLSVQNKGMEPHNWHLVDQKNPDGSDIKTKLGTEPDSITFQLDKPGSYPFLCDAHPMIMKGTLVVK